MSMLYHIQCFEKIQSKYVIMIYLLVDFFYFMCHDTTLYYDTTLTSLFINCRATSDLYLRGMHDTSYDSPIVTSLIDDTMHYRSGIIN
jgi:hypothetical protein